MTRTRDTGGNGRDGPQCRDLLTAVREGEYWCYSRHRGMHHKGVAPMQLSPSAHTDTFCRDNLPPRDQWPDLRFDLPELRYPERLNCGEALLDAAVAHFGPDRPCLRTPTETWTYGDLLRRANQAAQVFTDDFGLVPGNRVLLRGPNNPWLIAAWFGALKAGGVAVTTMPLLRAREITALTELTRPGLAVCDDRFADELTAAAPGPADRVLRRRIGRRSR